MAAKNSTHTAFDSFATNVAPCEVGGETVIDFDIDCNSDYEIQSGVVVKDGQVVEGAVRFGRVEEREEINVDHGIIYDAWINMVRDTIGETPESGGNVEYEANLSDFQHEVPHLNVRRENVEEYGFDAMTVEEFADVVETLAELVENVLRADNETMDATIDEWL